MKKNERMKKMKIEQIDRNENEKKKKERIKRKRTKRTKKRKDAKKKTTTPQRPSTPAYTHEATRTRKTKTFMSYCETFTIQELLEIVRQKLHRALLACNHPIRYGNLHLLSRDKVTDFPRC